MHNSGNSGNGTFNASTNTKENANETPRLHQHNPNPMAQTPSRHNPNPNRRTPTHPLCPHLRQPPKPSACLHQATSGTTCPHSMRLPHVPDSRSRTNDWTAAKPRRYWRSSNSVPSIYLYTILLELERRKSEQGQRLRANCPVFGEAVCSTPSDIDMWDNLSPFPMKNPCPIFCPAAGILDTNREMCV